MKQSFASGLKLSFSTALVLAALVGILGNAPGARAEQGDSDKNGPEIKHVPVTTVIRGQPANISAIITPEPGSVLTSKVVLVRLTDAGTPTSHPMGGSKEDNSYELSLPVSLIKSVNVFWYAIDARDEKGRIGGTIWYRVVIIDPYVKGGAGGAADRGGEAAAGAAAAGGGGNAENAGFIIGGILLAGGAAVLIDDDNNKDDEPDDAGPAPESSDNNNDNESDTPCTLSGAESVSYENLSNCGRFLFRGTVINTNNTSDILILVCHTCPNVTISAQGSWGASDSISNFNNPGCSTTVGKLVLQKPDGFPTPGSETITVLVGGNQIDQIVWPPLGDFDCF